VHPARHRFAPWAGTRMPRTGLLPRLAPELSALRASPAVPCLT